MAGSRLCYSLLPWDARVTTIKLLDERATWLELWHGNKFTQADGFFTEFWVTVESQGSV
jgi:hypothetical protein